MACVRLSSGREVMTGEEFEEWWQSTQEGRDTGAAFVDVLRQHLAKQMHLGHFRRLIFGSLAPFQPFGCEWGPQNGTFLIWLPNPKQGTHHQMVKAQDLGVR